MLLPNGWYYHKDYGVFHIMDDRIPKRVRYKAVGMDYDAEMEKAVSEMVDSENLSSVIGRLVQQVTQDMTQAADTTVTSPPAWDSNLGPTPLAEAGADEFEAQRKAAFPYIDSVLHDLLLQLFTFIEEDDITDGDDFNRLRQQIATLLLLEDGEL